MSQKSTVMVDLSTLQPRFKPGDTVWLKSGGPSMTVDFVASNQTVRCVWFSGDPEADENTWKYGSGLFNEACLVKNNDDEDHNS